MRSLGALFIGCLTLRMAHAAAPETLEQQDLFLKGQDGYHTFRIPALIVSSGGTLLAFCEGRKNSASDSGDIDIVFKRSTDGGRNWGKLEVLWNDGNNTCGNPCPVLDQQTRTLWLLLTHNPGQANEKQITAKQSSATRTIWLSSSADDGLSWSPPTEITRSVKDPTWGWYATGPGIGIQLQRGPHRGRLVVPCDHSYDGLVETGAKKGAGAHVIYSDDHGQNWKLGGSARPNMNECQVVELADGRLLLNMRNYARDTRRAHSFSSDGGSTWTTPVLQPELIEPRCQASILRFKWPSHGHPGCILFSNPAADRRHNLTIRASFDEAKSWPIAKTLHADAAAYSCLAALEKDVVGCLYERGSTNAYEKITFARLPFSSLRN
jgi:sialidase-1